MWRRENREKKKLMFSSNSAHAARRAHFESSPRTKTEDKTVEHKNASFLFST